MHRVSRLHPCCVQIRARHQRQTIWHQAPMVSILCWSIWRQSLLAENPRAEIFGDLIIADHKVVSESCESRHNHRYAVVVQDLATQWTQSYPRKQKLLKKQKRAYNSFWSRRGNQKSLTLTILWNLAKPVKIFPGIIVRLHLTDRKQMGLPKEQCAE